MLAVPDPGSDGAPDDGTSGTTDRDRDGIPDLDDSCPDLANPGQENEDGDRFGDPCDPCPIVTDDAPPDSDGDGVANACDPHANLVDRIVLFEGFHDGIPAAWSRSGTWSAGAGEIHVTAAAGEIATLRTGLVVTDRTKVSASVIVESVTPAAHELSVVTPMLATDGVGCSMVQPGAGTGRVLSIHDLGGGTSVFDGDFAWTEGTPYTLAMNRNLTTYACSASTAGSSKLVSSMLARGFAQPSAGLRSRGVTARVRWLLVVVTP